MLTNATAGGAQMLAEQQGVLSTNSNSQQWLRVSSPSVGDAGMAKRGAVQAAACIAGTGVSGNVQAVYDYCMAKLTQQELLALASQLSNTLLR
jgi:hypothetical protein